MKQLNITCRITTPDEEVVINAIGQMKNKRMVFTDEHHIKHYIIFERNKIVYIRQGAVDMKYAFQEHLTTKGTYQTLGKTLLFDIRTQEIIRKPSHLSISYQLLQDKQVVHDAVIDVMYQEIEEE